MAKALKVVAVVAGAVALVATGLGAAGVTTILGAKTATIAAIAGVASGVASLGAGLLTQSPTFNNDGSALSFQTNPQSGLPYCIGRTRMSGLKIAGKTGASSGSGTQDLLFFAVMLSCTPAQAIESFTADNVAVTFSGTAATSAPYAGWMGQTTNLGELPQGSALSLSLQGVPFPGWTSAHKLSGMAHALWALRYDRNGNVYSGGVPEPAWVGRWGKCYDPRKDSTYPGGSGSHRASNPATWEWTRNPGLHALTWCIGHSANGKRVCGIGAPLSSIRVADFVNLANICDANQWTCGGVEWTTDSKWDILKRILQAGGAEPVQAGAMIGCRVRTPRVSIGTITANDLLDEARLPTTKRRRDRFNRVLPRFRSEAHDWQVITGSAVVVSSYVSADGGERTKGIDYPLVQDEVGQSGVDGARQAGQLAAYDICDSREAGPWTITVGPKWAGLQPGDCVTLDLPAENISAQKVLVTARTIDPSTGKVSLTLETETDSKHAFALGQSTTPPPPFTPSVPQVRPAVPGDGSWSVTAITLADGQPRLRVAGTIDDPIADTVLVDYRPASGGAWRSAGALNGAGTLTRDIGPLDGATGFVVRLSYRSRGTQGDWLEKASVTTNAAQERSPLGTNMLANSHFRDGLNQWQLYYAGLDSGSSAAVLSMTTAGALRVDNANSTIFAMGSVGPRDGGPLRAGRHLVRVQAGQRLAYRLRGKVGGACQRVAPFFRTLNQDATVDLGTGAWGYGNPFSGFSGQIDSTSLQECAGWFDVPAGAWWVEMEFFGRNDGVTGAGWFELEACLLATIDSAQTVPPIWSEGSSSAYRADVTADSAIIQAITSDSVFDRTEKRERVIAYDALYENWQALDAKGVALGIASAERAAATSAMNALWAYLSALSPAWNDTGADTPIVAATFTAKWSDANAAVAALQAAIQGQPGVPGVAATLTLPSIALATSASGALRPGQRERVVGTLVLTVGGVATTSGVTFSVLSQSGMSGLTINTSGAYGPPAAITANPATAFLRASYAGQNYDLPLTVTMVQDGAAGTSVKTAVSSLNNTSTYVTSAFADIAVPAGGTLTMSMFTSYATGSGYYAPQIKLTTQNLTDGGAEVDVPGSEVVGDEVYPGEPSGVGTGGSMVNSTGALKIFRFALKSRRFVGTGGASASGTLYGETS